MAIKGIFFIIAWDFWLAKKKMHAVVATCFACYIDSADQGGFNAAVYHTLCRMC
jgi:hypothetical protein